MRPHAQRGVGLSEARQFAGKVALVTGAGRGIGRSIAAAFADAGADVAVCDIDRDASEATVSTLLGAGAKAAYFAVDLARSGAAREMVRSVARHFGRLDFLVNNARAGTRGAVEEESEDNWDLTVAVGLKAAYFASQEAIGMMASNAGGAIVNISSVSALFVSRETASYQAAKAGLLQLTRYLAVSAARHDVRVNAVLPGFIVQDEHRERYQRQDNAEYRKRAESLHPGGRVGSAADVAAAVLNLCSASSSFVTGQALIVDGGLTLQDPWAASAGWSWTP